MAGRERYEFGEFTLDAADRRLFKGGQAVPLEPKSHDLLVALVRRAGRLVTKRELLDLIWPGSFVEEGILAVHISGLRKALDSAAGPRRFIETVPRSGYRFVGVLTKPIAERPESETSEAPSRPEVFELFGRGRFHLLAMSVFDVPKAIDAFRAAIELDPTYAAAHAGLALACCAQAQLRLLPPVEAYAQAKAAALRALAMDGACADAQTALGAVLFFSEWDWAGAQRSLRRALELNPHHTEACLLLAQVWEALGRLEEGLALKHKALERDPFSPLVHLQISISYWNQHRYHEAIEWADKTLALDPHHPHAREHLAAAYLKQGDFDRHMAENLKHAERHGAPAEALAHLKRVYAEGGRAGVVKQFLRRASIQPLAFPALALAVHCAEAGDLDAAFHHLDRALESRDPAMVHLAVAPQWDSLRSDPRFGERLARMGLA